MKQTSSTLPRRGQSLTLAWLLLHSTQAGATAAGRSRTSSAKRRVTWWGTAGQRKLGRASSAMRRAILQRIARARKGSPVAPAGVQRSKASSASEALKCFQRKEDSIYWWTSVATGSCWRTWFPSRNSTRHSTLMWAMSTGVEHEWKVEALHDVGYWTARVGCVSSSWSRPSGYPPTPATWFQWRS